MTTQTMDGAGVRAAGRLVGGMILVQAFLGGRVNLRLLPPLFEGQGYLVNAAAMPWRLQASALMLLAAGLLGVAITITALPHFVRYSARFTYALLALSAAGVATIAVEVVTLLAMLSVSQQAAQAGGGDAFVAAGGAVRMARYWAHYVNLVVAGSWILVLYGMLARHALVHRVLAWFGVVAALINLVAITLPFTGARVQLLLIAPLGLSQMALALWLVVRGFRAPEETPQHQRPVVAAAY